MTNMETGDIEIERITILLPKRQKRDFMCACIRQGVDMSKVLRDFINEWMEKNKG